MTTQKKKKFDKRKSHTKGEFGWIPPRQLTCQAAIPNPGIPNGTPENAAWAKKLTKPYKLNQEKFTSKYICGAGYYNQSICIVF